jgi:hypothetical protein
MDERSFSLSQYPLSWPDGWTRTKSYQQKNTQFKPDAGGSDAAMAELNVARDEALRELEGAHA